MASSGLFRAVLFAFFLSVAVGNELLPITDDPHSIFQCPDPTEIENPPLCASDVKVAGQFLSTITRMVECPSSGINRQKIGCIVVRDLSENNDGGYASITNGGLNQFFVEIKLKSQWGKGLNYHIEVYNTAEKTTSSATTTA